MSQTLVILHGWGQSSFEWKQLREMLEKDFRVVVLDLPGFGGEPMLSPVATIPEYADWVVSKLNAIEGDKVILGHSFGGRIGSYIASSKPVWLKGLILYGSPSLYRPSLDVKVRIILFKIAKALGLKKAFTMRPKDLKDADKKNMGQIFRKAVVFDQTELLPKIDVPTLLVWGENDSAVPLRIAIEMKALIPNSTLSILDKVGHNAHLENPHLFYGIIKNFLTTL